MPNELTKAVANNITDFDEKVKPRKITDLKEMFFFQCECGGAHMRHAGYMEMLVPYVKADKEKKVDKTSFQVMVCTQCKRAYIWYDSQMYEVTSVIDLEAWEKAEKELHAATGPGGQC